MLTCEAMFLLLTTDAGKDEPWVSYRSEALRGALLADLAMAHAIDFGDGRDPEVRVTSLADAAQRTAAMRYGVETLRERGPVRASYAVQAGWFSPEDAVASDLCERGVLRVETSKFLFWSTEHYPVVDPEPEERLRHGLAAVLAGEQEPDLQQAVLLAILDDMSAVRTILSDEIGSLGSVALTRRIQEIRDAALAEDHVTEAVGSAIQTMQAVMSAVFISTLR